MAAMIQPVLALPQGVAVRRGELAAISQVIEDGQRFLEGQTGHRLRVAGRVVIVRLPFKAMSVRHLSAAGFQRIADGVDSSLADDTIHAVFYDAPNTMTGGWELGHTALISLGRLPFLNGWSVTWLHEVFHAVGIGHVADDPCDVMAPRLGGCAAFTLDSDRADYLPALLASPYLV